MSLEKNSIHEGIITGYESGGMGVCRLDGQVVFVERGVRGDRCRLRIVKALKNKAYARIEELLEPSPHRQEPCCPAFPKCGGCDFWHMQYEEELFAKRQRVQDALERLGGQSVPELEIVGGENFHYRNKAMYPCATEEGRPVAGFYRRRSHQVIPQENCAIQSPLADQLKEGVLRWAETCGVSIYEEETGRGFLRHIYVRTGKQGALLTLVVTSWKVPQPEKLIALCRESCPPLVGIVLNKNTRQTNRVLGEECRTLWGEGRLQDSLCGVEFSLSPLSFYQVNQPQAQRLYEQAVEYAAFSPEDTLLDLYCGTGTITLVMARHCREAVGVEIVPQAVEDARENARQNGITNTRFLCADAGQAAQQLLEEGFRPTVMVVDPPRKGLDEKAREILLRMNPRRVVYVSCDPATMARDIRQLTEGGYRLEKVRAFDLFPRTANVETVVLLLRETNPLTVEIRMEVETGEVKEHPTYKRIQEYVQEKYSFKVHTAYIAEVKRMVGLDMHKAPNAVEQRKHEYHPCPPEKVEAIKDALRHFGLIAE